MPSSRTAFTTSHRCRSLQGCSPSRYKSECPLPQCGPEREGCRSRRLGRSAHLMAWIPEVILVWAVGSLPDASKQRLAARRCFSHSAAAPALATGSYRTSRWSTRPIFARRSRRAGRSA
eukprot:1269454-Pleurochrysis_carterae.AAC.3